MKRVETTCREKICSSLLIEHFSTLSNRLIRNWQKYVRFRNVHDDAQFWEFRL